MRFPGTKWYTGRMRKIYCYVDESGQDTLGAFFIVAVIIKEQENIEYLESKLEEIEKKSGKRLLKWQKTAFKSRKNYFKLLTEVKGLRSSIFYSIYHNSKEYSSLTSLTIAKAILSKKMNAYKAWITIDGLTKRGMEKIRRELKTLDIHYKTIRGAEDQRSSILRLTDTVAGFLRDHFERQEYTEIIYRKLRNLRVIEEL